MVIILKIIGILLLNPAILMLNIFQAFMME